MYNGSENLINDGEYLPYSMLGFWQWAYSNLLQNMQRGTFAEFIVKSALDKNGVHENNTMKTGIEPYDLEGPWIPEYGRAAHIEVKCAAMVQLWDIKHPNRASFSIAPAKLPDITGDFRPEAPRQRNSDLYVFSLYTATDRRRNILDLSWWEFYVCSTNYLDEKYPEQKTISLEAIRTFCKPCAFDDLYRKISDVCSEISRHPDIRKTTFTPPQNELFGFSALSSSDWAVFPSSKMPSIVTPHRKTPGDVVLGRPSIYFRGIKYGHLSVWHYWLISYYHWNFPIAIPHFSHLQNSSHNRYCSIPKHSLFTTFQANIPPIYCRQFQGLDRRFSHLRFQYRQYHLL